MRNERGANVDTAGAKAGGNGGGGGALVRSGKPSPSIVFVPPARDFEVIEHAVARKGTVVSLLVTLAGGFFARLGLAWEVFRGRGIPMLLHTRVALDISRRLMQAAAHAELGDEEGVGSDDE